MCCKIIWMWYNKNRKTTARAVRAIPIGLRLLGHYRMACMNQSAASYGLASWMHPQRWVAGSKGQKIRLSEQQITEAVFLCLDYCVAKIFGCGIIKIEGQPPTRWVAGFIVKRKSTPLLASFGVVFLCLDYCVAKIFGCGIIKIERQPPTRWVADS